MKFENYEVEQKYYEIHRKYNVTHSIPADRNKIISYSDLEELEKEFKYLNDLFSKDDD